MCVDASALEVSRTAGVPHIDGPHRRFVRSRVCTCYDARLPVWCRRARCANCAEVCTKCAERRCGARFRPLLRCAASPRGFAASFHRTVLAHRSCTPFLHTVRPRRSSTPCRRTVRMAVVPCGSGVSSALPCRSTLPFRYAVSPCGPRGAWGCLGTKLDRVVGPPGDRWGSAAARRRARRGGGRGARPRGSLSGAPDPCDISRVPRPEDRDSLQVGSRRRGFDRALRSASIGRRRGVARLPVLAAGLGRPDARRGARAVASRARGRRRPAGVLSEGQGQASRCALVRRAVLLGTPETFRRERRRHGGHRLP